MKCKTNEDLWAYQSAFLDRRSIRVSAEYDEKWFYNKSAVYNYMMKCIFVYDEESILEEEKRHAIRLLQNLKTPGDEFGYHGYTITLTNRPYPRVLSEDPHNNSYVLLKKLDDIPILCKGPIGSTGDIWGDLSICLDESWNRFNLVQVSTVVADWLPDDVYMYDRYYTLGKWGNCVRTDALHGSLHYWDGIDEIVSGDILLTGVEDSLSKIPYAFDLRAYLQDKEESKEDPRYFFDDYFGILNRDNEQIDFGKEIGLTEKEIQLYFPDDIGGSYKTKEEVVQWGRYWIE